MKVKDDPTVMDLHGKWTFTEFVYTRDHVDKIVELLELNQNSIVATYEILSPKTQTVEWLRLIEAISKLASFYNFNPSKVWLAHTHNFTGQTCVHK